MFVEIARLCYFVYSVFLLWFAYPFSTFPLQNSGASSPNLVANPEAEISAWQFLARGLCVCVCECLLWRGFSSEETGKQAARWSFTMVTVPSFLNCNFPSFSSAERSLSLPYADNRPLIMSRIHTNCILYFVSRSLGSASFWLRSVVRSFMMADVSRDEQAFMYDCLILLTQRLKILQR